MRSDVTINRDLLFRVAASALLLSTSVPATARTACPAQFADGTEPRLVKTQLARSARPLCYSAFAVLHSGVSRTPLYVAERLTRASVEGARALVEDGAVTVNGEVETRRGRQLRDGDVVALGDNALRIAGGSR